MSSGESCAKSLSVRESERKSERVIEKNSKMKVLKNYGRDNTTRRSNEAMRIAGNKGVRLNSKAEFRQPRIPRLVINGNRNE